MRRLTFIPSFKLKTKLQLSFLLIGLLSVSLTSWVVFENARNTIESITFDRLTSIRETKKRQIESYFQQIRNQAITLSEDRMTIEATRGFIGAFKKIQFPLQREEFFASLGVSTERNAQFAAYARIHAYYHPIFLDYLQRFGYTDIFLVDAETGDVVYSVLKKKDLASSLQTGPLSQTNIAGVFRDARATTHPGFVKLADFSPYSASDSVPASFVASPIFDGGKKVGVLIFQISITLINQVMTSDNNWRAEGLGETGETYIVGSDRRMRTDSRFFIQEPDLYFKRLLRMGTDSAIVRQIQSRSTSILLQEVRTAATIDALRGNTNTKIIDDYRGIPVLSSYTPLRIPDVQWVMLSEIDTSEAFGSVMLLRERLILLGLVILMIAVMVGFFISRTISRPILALASATQKFGEGSLTHRIGVTSNDEIGILGTAFNLMAENTMQKTTELQNEISERRRADEEVRVSQQRLQSLSAHLQTAREEERKGVAREIHDELGQALTTLKLNLALLKEEIDPSNLSMHGKIASMLDLINATIRSVKRMITALRPRLLDDLGLTAAIEWQTEEFQQRTGIACELTICPEEILLDPDRSTAIFRIFQEALTNVARHSHADHLSINLIRENEELVLRVHDNGRGISDADVDNPKSFGLIGIRERASYWRGTVQIDGIHNEGTTLAVRFPIMKEEIA